MHSSIRLASTLLALSTLISALPQQSAQNTAVAYNPINGLPLPVAESTATATATASTSKPTSNNDDDEDTESESPSAKATITAAPTLSPTSPPSHKSSSDSDSETETDSDTDSSSTTDTESSSSSSSDPSLIIWTDTAEHTIYTMTRVSSTSTSSIPIPTMGVPPNSDQVHPTVVMVEITNSAGQEEVVPTSNVDTFVQAYTGKAAPRERVWWLLGLVGAVAALL